ncbi:DEAD/DEAH box helicase [Candidatus Fermentibacteria bacterium]|nr:DEAD/DEAH box helicase [Candidatus Fermentibacteria bacterium]
MSVLSLFHPWVARWFEARMGDPTQVQRSAWPCIARGDHVLMIAPTGSGKTMAAFLWAIDRLVRGQWPSGQTSVLYVSPLRALNNDIQRNLIVPLHELRQEFCVGGEPMPRIRVLTRSGDTPSAARQAMIRHPPEILITTPESLNLLLSSPRGRGVLGEIKAVILDEVHAVLGTKRGTYLITAVDRLVAMAGEFQRIALSATVQPEDEAARFIGGYVVSGPSHDPAFTARDVVVIRTAPTKTCELRVALTARIGDQDGSFWDTMALQMRSIIARNRSTLFFTTSRRVSERLTLAINRAEDATVAYAHHGSLSREIRHDVEQRLKSGQLKAIVATHSLELGIDIGSIDEVVLVSCPSSVSSALQRIGRSGHRVGGISRGVFVPTHAHDLVEAAALVPAVLSGDIEPTRPVACPLDVLAQIIVSMVGIEQWDIDSLFAAVRTSHPFNGLTRRMFDLVLGMLAGRFADTRIRELAPLVCVDRIAKTVVGRRGSLLTLYASGGVIPDRGYFHLRRQDGARVGELDEEFVWEASPGESFTLGSQTWRIQRITHNDVVVTPVPSRAASTPFWRGEGYRRDAHFSELIGRFLETAADRAHDPDFAATLVSVHHLEPAAAEALVGFLQSQASATGCDVPHRHHLVVEHVDSGPGGGPGTQVIIHSCFGLRVNHPWALALGAAWEQRHGFLPEIYPSNDTIVVVLAEDMDAGEILSMVAPGTLDALVRRRLEGSGIFAARFREAAGRALLLPRRRVAERMPLWMNRLRSQKLFEAVRDLDDFPILLEAWRTCLQDEFDLDRLHLVLWAIEAGSIRWSHVRTGHPSPFARCAAWRQINEYMYMGDKPTGRSRADADLINEVARSPHLRPKISADAAKRFAQKRQRLIPGYVPTSASDLLDWVRERIAIPAAEWEMLREHIARETCLPEVIDSLATRLVWLVLPGGATLLMAVEDLSRVTWALHPGTGAIAHALSGRSMEIPACPDYDPDELLPVILSDWLRFYGPLPQSAIADTLGVGRERACRALDALEAEGKIVCGELTEESVGRQICEAANFMWILKSLRRETSWAFEPLPADRIASFLAFHQGVAPQGNSPDATRDRVSRLAACPASAGLWETEILPARLRGYAPAWLDALLREGEMRWIGCGDRRVVFTRWHDLDLVRDEPWEPSGGSRPDETTSLHDIFPDPWGKYDLSTLMLRCTVPVRDLVDRLWRAVWEGEMANDSFLAVRRGVGASFQLAPSEASPERGRRPSRSAFGRWRGSLPLEGNWYRIPWPEPGGDGIEREERQKERIRILLNRYGILFRELLEHELCAFRWSRIFRSLRIMELSGEVVSGRFFEGIPGLQFMAAHALGSLREAGTGEVFWLSAADPASLCGVPVTGLSVPLPTRLPGTHLVYHGDRLVVISQRHGGEVTFFVSPSDTSLPRYLTVFTHLLTRPVQPQRRIVIERINGEMAASSPYLASFRAIGEIVVEHTKAALYRRF